MVITYYILIMIEHPLHGILGILFHVYLCIAPCIGWRNQSGHG